VMPTTVNTTPTVTPKITTVTLPTVSLPPEYCFYAESSPSPGFENCLPSARVPGPLPPPPTLVQDYSFSAQNLSPIASQPDYSNPSAPAPTNSTTSPPSLNHLNSLRILQWNSSGLFSSRCAEICFFLSSNRPERSDASPRDSSLQL